MESEPERARFRLWVAEADGRVAGYAMAALHRTMSTPDVAWLWGGVTRAARGRGLGRALLDLAEEHLLAQGARKVEGFALDGSEGHAFLERRGYRRTRVELKQTLDVARADVGAAERFIARKEAEGFTLVRLREVHHRARELHAVYAAATADIPADDPEDDVRFEDWEAQDFGDPELSLDGSFVVLHENRPVALAFLLVNEEAGVAVNEMTGTLAGFRRRGLARLAKLGTIRWAEGAGLRTIHTANDAENAPMLGLNRSLGYEVRARSLSFAKELVSE